MLERVGTRMPTTSTPIASLHGRLNGKIPRFNCFWASLHRLREAIMRKTENYSFAVNHNLCYQLGRTSHRVQILSPDRMEREMVFFHTVEESCLWGETVFAIGMHRMDVLCCHRINHMIRTHFPIRRTSRVSTPGIADLEVTMEWTSCELRIEIRERNVLTPDNPSREMEVEPLVRLIVKDAHAQRRRAEVRVFVQGKLKDSAQFALGESRSFLKVHRKGVSAFRRARTQPSSGGGRPAELPGVSGSS
jgi:hypothetical protein